MDSRHDGNLTKRRPHDHSHLGSVSIVGNVHGACSESADVALATNGAA